jgi:hydroxymethylpyrimidine/phosphomethylpyrimidine kinase
MKKPVLTIAGSDPSGGAGVQADLKALSANGVFGMSVLTSITAQNTCGVSSVFHLPSAIIEAQLDAIFSDISVKTIKTGMLATPDIIAIVSNKLATQTIDHLVVDPVMVAKGGHVLLEDEGIASLKSELCPQAFLITPNIYEAQVLSGMTINSIAEARAAAKIIHQLGCRHVLITGGHLQDQPGTDLLYDGRFFRMLKGEYIQTQHTHGTGCTLASAIAAHLAKGKSITNAVEAAKAYTTEAIRHSFPLGKGHGPTDHFYFLQS